MDKEKDSQISYLKCKECHNLLNKYFLKFYENGKIDFMCKNCIASILDKEIGKKQKLN